MAWRLMPNIAAKSFWLVWSDSLSVAKTRPWPRRGSKHVLPRGDLAPGETSRLCIARYAMIRPMLMKLLRTSFLISPSAVSWLVPFSAD